MTKIAFMLLDNVRNRTVFFSKGSHAFSYDEFVLLDYNRGTLVFSLKLKINYKYYFLIAFPITYIP